LADLASDEVLVFAGVVAGVLEELSDDVELELDSEEEPPPSELDDVDAGVDEEDLLRLSFL
jgi:hypothetical protein